MHDIPDVLLTCPLPDGRAIVVMPLLFGRARLGIGPAGSGWFSDVWDYGDPGTAIVRALAWDGQGEPGGWERWDGPNGERRYRPGGDPAAERGPDLG